MNLKDMVIGEEKRKDMAEPSLVADQPKYPYGLTLSLDNDTLKKLELGGIPKVGDKKMLLAVAEVVSVSQDEGRGDEKAYNVRLQIQKLDCKAGEEEQKSSSVSEKLYGGE